MITLAIDTSAHLCAAALHDSESNSILTENSEDIGRGHAERLMDTIAQVMAEAGTGYSDLGRIAVCVGPGSFTGLRVGLAAARGMALGLGVPAVGVSVLDAMKLAADEAGSHDPASPLLVVLDARRGEVYAQFFGCGESLPQAPFVATCEELDAMIARNVSIALCGSGADRLVEVTGRDLPVLHRLAAAPIACFARLGAAAEATGIRPEPLYLRAPDAKPQAGFALERA